MKFSQLAKRLRLYAACFMIVLLGVACGSGEPVADPGVRLPPTPASGQPVEYGASLSEWEEASQADGNSDGTISEAEEVAELVIEAWPETADSSYPVAATLEPVVPLLDGAASAENEPGAASSENADEDVSVLVVIGGVTYQEIVWEALIPPDFTADSIRAKYAEELAQYADGSEEIYDIYQEMQEELNNAPINASMDGVNVRLPGFIAPLTYEDDLITEFLLVPYFGACIHVPPPPANQTVLVKLPEGQGISIDDSYNPFWIMGELKAEAASTDLAEAGYYIDSATFELYSYD